MHRWLFLSLAAAASAFGQTTGYPYVVQDVIGTLPVGNGGPALSAYLYNPNASVPDGSGNLYIADSSNGAIRVITPDGNINNFSVASSSSLPYVYDMKRGKDGSLYLAASGEVLKVSPAGAVTTIAGTGTSGFSGDGGPATSAQVGQVQGIALDAAGDVFIVENNQHRLREITLNGNINTIAGNGTANYSGDKGPATAAQLNSPTSVAVDQAGNIYVADQQNRRIRKIGLDGNINTIAGDGASGQPKDGVATTSPLGIPYGIAVDSSGNVYFTDITYGIVLKLTSDGNMKRVAGNYSPFGFYNDGVATNGSLRLPRQISPDASGNLYITDYGTQRVRELTLDGNIHTVAGALHDAGDGGPAPSAVLYQPHDVAIDSQGNIFVADSYNYYIRKVTAGTITAYAGNGTSGYPSNGSPGLGSPIEYVYAMGIDSTGALYLASNLKVLKLSAAGTFTTFAGTGSSGNTGDGGPATAATFQRLSGIALDSAGNVYVADSIANRIRKISAATGTISPFAGTGSSGFSGDGALATNALLNLNSLEVTPLAVDKNGDVFIGDVGNQRIRMVTPAGTISTVVGNGILGIPTDGQPAVSTPFSAAGGIAVDSAGDLFVTSQTYQEVYSVVKGIIQRIGGGALGTADNSGGLATLGAFNTLGLKLDANGDLYVSSGANKVRELIPNSPSSFTVSNGNNQTGLAGAALTTPLIVKVLGQGGIGIAGITISFAVTSGSATLSAASVQTDINGMASVAVTLGSALGKVGVTATAAGLSLPPVQFTATAVAPGSSCAVSAPSITSVNSATDFGGFSTFASGSWLEVKGSNLAPDTRQWGGTDFQGANAPTSLDGSSVSINGNAGFVYYISGTQMNVQAPADPTVGAVQITVTNCAGISGPVTIQKSAIAPGLLAPASFNVNGTQYLAAQFQDGTFVGNAGLISGVAFRPATPGDSITVYGVGFGPVTPAIAPGVVVSQSNSIPGLTISFGQTPAATTYAGLSPGFVGLYQFDITVPNVQAGDYPINVSVGGVPVAQTFYLTVQ